MVVLVKRVDNLQIRKVTNRIIFYPWYFIPIWLWDITRNLYSSVVILLGLPNIKFTACSPSLLISFDQHRNCCSRWIDCRMCRILAIQSSHLLLIPYLMWVFHSQPELAMKTKLFTLIEVLDLNLLSASENYTTVTELSLWLQLQSTLF